jgi:NAD(P)-dependent dehydrogenase (short-subunit alcohol dehydrogenase family)
MPAPVCIITAATGLIGTGITRALARSGWNLALLSLPEGSAEALASEVNGIGHTGSVTNADDLNRIVDATIAKWGRVDGLVNNTGHAPKGKLAEFDDQAWQAGYEILLLNVIRMSRLVMPIMASQGGGSIVNISTFTAFEPATQFPISSVIRAALGSYCKLYADEFGSSGIRMNNVLPGFVDDNDPFPPDLVEKIPLKRPAQVMEIASVVDFLLSDRAGYVTGQNLRVDGGFTRSV